jgi:hypothetical protein
LTLAAVVVSVCFFLVTSGAKAVDSAPFVRQVRRCRLILRT